MKKIKLFAVYIFSFMLITQCSGDDESESGEILEVGSAHVRVALNDEEVFHRATNSANPSQDLVTAMISIQEFTHNGITIPANSLMIYSADQNYQSSGMGKTVYILVSNISGTGSYELVENEAKFYYMDTTDPSDSYICYIDEPYETDGFLTITEIGNINPEGFGRFVKGTISATAMAGGVSNPNDLVTLEVDFDGGIPD